ncbi:MAG: hypothetical protein EOO17_01810 [Chloroflexi bacterium]|nr:MAG: hypothetical protein EOO17_01810 [Chloroflexota bacterium]
MESLTGEPQNHMLFEAKASQSQASTINTLRYKYTSPSNPLSLTSSHAQRQITQNLQPMQTVYDTLNNPESNSILERSMCAAFDIASIFGTEVDTLDVNMYQRASGTVAEVRDHIETSARSYLDTHQSIRAIIAAIAPDIDTTGYQQDVSELIIAFALLQLEHADLNEKSSYINARVEDFAREIETYENTGDETT